METNFKEEAMQALCDTFQVCANKSFPHERISAEERGEALEGADCLLHASGWPGAFSTPLTTTSRAL